jgi:hypothetical protein
MFGGQTPLSGLQVQIPAKYNNLMTKILYRVHAVQRMFERIISPAKVRRALEAGDVIEDYSNEMPEPSRLIMGFQGKRPFHIVTSENLEADEITVVTVYLPDVNKWKKDFRSRK